MAAKLLLGSDMMGAMAAGVFFPQQGFGGIKFPRQELGNQKATVSPVCPVVVARLLRFRDNL